jgi:cytochrome c-type biogenesis protein CcmH
MCPTCGTLLQLAESPQAQDERDFIRRKIAQGETKDQIKDDLVQEFGDAVLASPPASGFDLTAYLVPALALLLGLVGIVVGVRRWRRADRDAGHPETPIEPAESERLDADLARYDL